MLFENRQNWIFFLHVLLEEISEKPISFPEIVFNSSLESDVPKKYGKAFRVFSKIRRFDPERKISQIVSLKIETETNKGLIEYFVNLQSNTRVSYRMNLVGIEPENAFKMNNL